MHAYQKALEKSDGVISFGVVIRGETTHYELISESVAQGLMQVSIDAKKPLALGLIATENFDQAKRRCDPSELNKGKEIAQSLAETLGKDHVKKSRSIQTGTANTRMFGPSNLSIYF